MSESRSPEFIFVLRWLWDERVSMNKMALALGVTKNAIKGQADRLGLPVRPELNSRYHQERGIPLNPRYLRSIQLNEGGAGERNGRRRRTSRWDDGAIEGATLPALASLAGQS
jgi:hypothetical protein